MASNGTFKVGDHVEYDSSEGRAQVGVIENIRDTEKQPLRTGIPPCRFLFTVLTSRGYRTVYESACRKPTQYNVMG